MWPLVFVLSVLTIGQPPKPTAAFESKESCDAYGRDLIYQIGATSPTLGEQMGWRCDVLATYR